MGLKLYKLVLGTETGLGTIALGKQVTVLKQTVEVCPNLYGRCCEKPLAQFDKKLAGSIVCSLQSCAIVLSSATPFSVTSSVKISFPANADTTTLSYSVIRSIGRSCREKRSIGEYLAMHARRPW